MWEDRSIFRTQEFTGASLTIFMPTDESNKQMQ